MSERIVITIDTDNAAFEERPATEIARILMTLAVDFSNVGGPADSRLFDFNGNVVGSIIVERQP